MSITKKLSELRDLIEQKWWGLTFGDNRMFQLAMCREPEKIALKLIRAALPWPVDAIQDIANEKDLFQFLDDKECRLDILVKTCDRNVNVEMESREADKYYLMRRLRVYQAQSDLALIKPGSKYKDILDLCQVVISRYQPFAGDNWALYHFTTYCERLAAQLAASVDGVHKFVYNAKGTLGLEEISPDMLALFRYLNENAVGDNQFILDIDRTVAGIKKDTELKNMFVKDTLAYNQDMFDARAEGHAEGLAEGEGKLESLIQAMKDAGKTLEFICKEIADKSKRSQLYKQYGIEA
ncbi:MAG: hypothetical protein IJ228_02055 [Succinivibrio sp.]|nr:hypothetical protein [Succinivibrio sp.]